jgi:saccharopine dehydrogenase (NADP+, L-glutamate forming)
LDLPANTTIKDWWTMYLPCQASQFKDYFQLNDNVIHQLQWIGLMSDNPLPMLKGTSAQILETILKDKWSLQSDDKDLIVMIHEIDYEINGTMKRAQSVLHLNGESNVKTAMAKTVGMPLAIAAVMVYEQKVEEKGVIIPTDKHLGTAILKQLEPFGVVFKETEWVL